MADDGATMLQHQPPAICSGECPIARLLPTHLRRSDWRAIVKRQAHRLRRSADCWARIGSHMPAKPS
ncbi:hypothetical protein ACM43_09765 [Bradyrhizobium sp. CCBAU 45321]|nr:hypothetical protein [Bradyrhizobium sp. CCBAU 45321]